MFSEYEYKDDCPDCGGTGEIEDLCCDCRGSGEGRYSGSTCCSCKGHGAKYRDCDCNEYDLEEWKEKQEKRV